MGANSKWSTTFLRQCFVTTGVFLNMMAHGLSTGFSAMLLPQLQRPESSIQIDDNSGSWIAAMIGISLVIGNLAIPSIMEKFGRKIAHIVSIVPVIIGWIISAVAQNVTMLLISRFFQGLSTGCSMQLGSVLIGEYTSPRNRGAFLTTVSLAMSCGVLMSHSIGCLLHWRPATLFFTGIAVIALVIVSFSPESPSWLIDQGRYEESKRVFRWLRGDSEEEELRMMIEANMVIRESNSHVISAYTFRVKMQRLYAYYRKTAKKKEFYLPVLIMTNMFAVSQWSGINLFSPYAQDVFKIVVGEQPSPALMTVGLTSQRVVSNIFAVYLARKMKRRSMYFSISFSAVLIMLVIAGYSFARHKQLISFDHPAIGSILIHLHMFTIAVGTLTLPFTILGELFPLEYRSLSGGISTSFLSINLFMTTKTVQYFFANLGLHGAYCIYAGVTGLFLVIPWMYLPETKDRILQDIENELRGMTPMNKECLDALNQEGKRSSTILEDF